MVAKNKSIKVNMILNAIKGLMSIFFPLISFPYVSKVLGVDNIGRYNFANSIISYFILLAGLGINTYAIREGARLRDKENEFKQFANEMFSINILSTIISYVLFVLLLIIVPKFQCYKMLLIILSLQIIFKTIGIEWIYSIYEDYAYITLRSIIFQIISLILLFVLVRNENSVNTYAAITVISAVGSNVLNYFHAKKYCKVNFVWKTDWNKHLCPIMVLFAMSVTVTIYVSSDTTILGFLCDDYTVGVYSVSVKIYSIVKTVLSSILIVSIPRLSALLGTNNKKEFNFVASDIYKTLLTVVIPAITGIILLRNQIVLLLSDVTYISASSSLLLLSIALFFCLGAWFWGQCILVPIKMEGTVFKITVVSALVNIGLNFVLIPIWKENAAALTTVIAEAISFIWCWYKGNKIVKLEGTIKSLLKIVVGCIAIIAVSLGCGRIFGSGNLYLIVTIIVSVVIYGVIEIILKNEALYGIIGIVKKKML